MTLAHGQLLLVTQLHRHLVPTKLQAYLLRQHLQIQHLQALVQANGVTATLQLLVPALTPVWLVNLQTRQLLLLLLPTLLRTPQRALTTITKAPQ